MISRTGIHAVKSLAVLAGLPNGEYLGATAIAEKIHAPQNYLGKILRVLAREGLLISQKGKGGGVRLARDAGQISLYEVLEPIEQVSQWDGCFLGNGECSSDHSCGAHEGWKPVRNQYLNFLRTTTIKDIEQKSVCLA